MKFTPEQRSLLATAVANPSVVLMTARNSPNDQVWRALVDRGMLEVVREFDDPAMREMVRLLDLSAYRLRPHVAKRVADFKQAFQPVGNA